MDSWDFENAASLILRDSSNLPGLFSLLHRRLLVLSPHLGLQPAETVAFPVDELADLGESRVDFLDFAPYFLRNEAVIRMTLRHSAQLA